MSYSPNAFGWKRPAGAVNMEPSDDRLDAQESRGGSLLFRGHHFFCDLLKHMLVQNQLGDEPFQAIDVAFQLAAPAIGIDLCGVMLLSPSIVGGLGYALFATNVRDCVTAARKT